MRRLAFLAFLFFATLSVFVSASVVQAQYENLVKRIPYKQITLEGDLYESGMRRIFSILDAPPELQSQAKQASDEPQETQERLVAMASKTYFTSVQSMIDDIRGKRQSTDFHTWGQVGMWFEKYARKIDRLPVLNVDPELLEWGAWVSSQMRDAESAMKGIGAQSRIRQQEVQPQYNVQTYSVPVGVNRWGAYSWNGWIATYDVQRTGKLKSNVRTQEKIRGNTSANLIMQGLEQSLGEIRRSMSQKYQLEF